MELIKKNYNQNFTGLTKIYAISDSHQETRKTRAFLSKILKDCKDDKNVLFLNCGDIFKGIYPKDLERDSYIKLKDTKPDIEMVMTLGNNDFGFNKESLEYLIDTVKNFTSKGIKTVCANIFEAGGSRPKWLKPYTVIERDGDRTFVTGFCIDNINTSKFGIVPKKQSEVMDEIYDTILKEKPDNVVILNHDYMQVSKDIVKAYQAKGIKVDLTIGGHDHDFVPPDKTLNIYYPQSLSDSMYKINLINNNGNKVIADVNEIKNENLKVDNLFEKDLNEYEQSSGLLKEIAPYTLNLVKRYSEPSPLGSFLADEMKAVSGADIGFFSTGFLMKPMEYKENAYITNYLFKKTIIADTPIKTVELDSAQLKAVFQNALKSNGYGSSNPKFLQCSNNIRIEGKNNPDLGMWEVKQIYIDKSPILDENAEPLSLDKKYKCAIDSYIAEGSQGFTTLLEAEKSDVTKNGETVKINEVLMNGLKQAVYKYQKGSAYPKFDLVDIQ